MAGVEQVSAGNTGSCKATGENDPTQATSKIMRDSSLEDIMGIMGSDVDQAENTSSPAKQAEAIERLPKDVQAVFENKNFQVAVEGLSAKYDEQAQAVGFNSLAELLIADMAGQLTTPEQKAVVESAWADLNQQPQLRNILALLHRARVVVNVAKGSDNARVRKAAEESDAQLSKLFKQNALLGALDQWAGTGFSTSIVQPKIMQDKNQSGVDSSQGFHHGLTIQMVNLAQLGLEASAEDDRQEHDAQSAMQTYRHSEEARIETAIAADADAAVQKKALAADEGIDAAFIPDAWLNETPAAQRFAASFA